MNKYVAIQIWIMLLVYGISSAQETLNADDPSSFIFGGDQKSYSTSISFQTIYLVDVESDPDNSIRFIVDGTAMEAGLPAMGAVGNGIETNETLWLNFTSRSPDKEEAVITVRTNQPLPADIIITVRLINTSSGGNFKASEENIPIILSETSVLLVDKIDNGYTANGLFNGYQIQYSVQNDQGKSLPSGFEIIYEINPK